MDPIERIGWPGEKIGLAIDGGSIHGGLALRVAARRSGSPTILTTLPIPARRPIIAIGLVICMSVDEIVRLSHRASASTGCCWRRPAPERLSPRAPASSPTT